MGSFLVEARWKQGRSTSQRRRIAGLVHWVVDLNLPSTQEVCRFAEDRFEHPTPTLREYSLGRQSKVQRPHCECRTAWPELSSPTSGYLCSAMWTLCGNSYSQRLVLILRLPHSTSDTPSLMCLHTSALVGSFLG